jgi:hypothetical protein
MSDAQDLQWLLDRELIRDLIHRYALAIDSRDWPGYRACFTDQLELDFSAASGAPAGTIEHLSADEWVARCQSFFERLTATQHIPALLRADISGATSEAVMQLHAQHHHPGLGGGDVQTMIGRYALKLLRDGNGHTAQWRIARAVLTVSWMEGNPKIPAYGFGML